MTTAEAGPLPQDLMTKLEATPTGQLMLRWLFQRSTRKLSPHTVRRYVNDHQRVLTALASVTRKDLAHPREYSILGGEMDRTSRDTPYSTWMTGDTP